MTILICCTIFVIVFLLAASVANQPTWEYGDKEIAKEKDRLEKITASNFSPQQKNDEAKKCMDRIKNLSEKKLQKEIKEYESDGRPF